MEYVVYEDRELQSHDMCSKEEFIEKLRRFGNRIVEVFTNNYDRAKACLESLTTEEV